MIWGASGFCLAGIDGRRFVDSAIGFRDEQALADEFGEAQGRHGHAMEPRRDAQQQIGDHGGEDLQADGVVVGAEELADIEMLLDPAEQQFDLPAALVESGDLDRRRSQIVGDESEASARVAPDADEAQRDRQLGIALAGEYDLAIVEDAEAIAVRLRTNLRLMVRKRMFFFDRVTKKAPFSWISRHQPK